MFVQLFARATCLLGSAWKTWGDMGNMGVGDDVIVATVVHDSHLARWGKRGHVCAVPTRN